MHKMQVDARVNMPATSETPAPTPPTNAVCWVHQENTLRANEPSSVKISSEAQHKPRWGGAARPQRHAPAGRYRWHTHTRNF